MISTDEIIVHTLKLFIRRVYLAFDGCTGTSGPKQGTTIETFAKESRGGHNKLTRTAYIRLSPHCLSFRKQLVTRRWFCLVYKRQEQRHKGSLLTVPFDAAALLPPSMPPPPPKRSPCCGVITGTPPSPVPSLAVSTASGASRHVLSRWR